MRKRKRRKAISFFCAFEGLAGQGRVVPKRRMERMEEVICYWVFVILL